MIRFRFEDSGGDVLRAVAHWEFHYHARLSVLDRGYIILPVAPGVFAGKTHGEVTAALTPERAGRYVYHVQVEDVEGRKSNVLQGSFLVDIVPPWGQSPPTCEPMRTPSTEHATTP